ncbi:MAG: DUF4339 domain-containing protein [Desulfobacterales bacterium]|nr:DUF4339 domain-containing protein [Desulfobacterales bacterium]
MNWYYAIDREQVGPVDDKTFKELIYSEIIVGKTYVWNQSMEDWKTLDKIDLDISLASQILPNEEQTHTTNPPEKATDDKYTCQTCSIKSGKRVKSGFNESKIFGFFLKIASVLTLLYIGIGTVGLLVDRHNSLQLKHIVILIWCFGLILLSIFVFIKTQKVLNYIFNE